MPSDVMLDASVLIDHFRMKNFERINGLKLGDLGGNPC